MDKKGKSITVTASLIAFLLLAVPQAGFCDAVHELIKTYPDKHSDYFELKKKACYNPDSLDEIGRNYLMSAIIVGDMFHAYQFMMTYKEKINLKDNYGYTALMFALIKNKADLIHDLVNLGARLPTIESIKHAIKEFNMDLRLILPYDQTLLHFALNQQEYDFARYLLENAADVNTTDRAGFSALTWAAARGNKELVDLILAKGGDRHHLDSYFRTPYIWAKINGHQEIADKLFGGQEIGLYIARLFVSDYLSPTYSSMLGVKTQFGLTLIFYLAVLGIFVRSREFSRQAIIIIALCLAVHLYANLMIANAGNDITSFLKGHSGSSYITNHASRQSLWFWLIIKAAVLGICLRIGIDYWLKSLTAEKRNFIFINLCNGLILNYVTITNNGFSMFFLTGFSGFITLIYGYINLFRIPKKEPFFKVGLLLEVSLTLAYVLFCLTIVCCGSVSNHGPGPRI
ncbi:MAG: ankyrin repeat domain-containing protein [Candidatus Wallbacteria bacterium]|nr:ankyrin repeat domain-containing protein [Candidatus Wallbacteria bacterium]